MSRDKITMVVLVLAVLLLGFAIVRSCTRGADTEDEGTGSSPAVLRTEALGPPAPGSEIPLPTPFSDT